MTNAITAINLEEKARPCLNPNSILWPRWPEEVQSQKTMKTQRNEKPITILNKDWKKEM